MNKKTTPSTTSPFGEKQPLTGQQLVSGHQSTSGKLPSPSEQTLAFLRSFASNYHAEMQLPQGLQGIMLG